MADDFHDKAYNQLIADLDIEKGNPSTNHYPLFQELHCRYCYIKTPHTFRGMLEIKKRRPSMIPKQRIISYMCDQCKYMADFKYSSPDEDLKFIEARLKD